MVSEEPVDGLALARAAKMGDVVVVVEKSKQKAALKRAFGETFPLIFPMEGHTHRPVSPDEGNAELQDWSKYPILVPEERRFDWVFNEHGADAKFIKYKRNTVKAYCAAAAKAKFLILAGDYDNEGEWILWAPLVHELGWWIDRHGKTTLLRAPITELNNTALTRAFRNLHPAEKTFGRALAARVRSEVDMAMGYTLSAALTTTFRPKDAPRDSKALAYGRVKNGLAGILYHREKEIRTFTAEAYYELRASTSVPGLFLTWKPGDDRMTDRDEVERLRRELADVEGPVAVKRETVHTPPPKPFSTTTLQKAAGVAFGWDPSKTDEIANALYHGQAITYPRTSAEILEEGEVVARAAEWLDFARAFWPDWRVPDSPTIRKTVFSDSAYAAGGFSHGAIMPDFDADGGLIGVATGLSGDQAKLFELICSRAVQVLSPDAVHDSTVVTMTIDEPGGRVIEFRAQGAVPVDDGWRSCAGGSGRGRTSRNDAEVDEAAEPALPAVEHGQTVVLEAIDVVEKVTTPPKRFRAAEITELMSKAHKYVQDPRLAKIVREDMGGIGTGATRSNIVDEMYRQETLVKVGGDVTLSERAYRVCEVLETADPLLIDAGWSAVWDAQYKKIEAGTLAPERLLDVLARDLAAHVEILRQQDPLPATFFGDGGSRAAFVTKQKRKSDRKRSRQTA